MINKAKSLVVVRMAAAVEIAIAVGKEAFTIDIAKASYKRLEKQFFVFILFKTAPSCFIKANTTYNVLILTIFH